MKFQGMRLSIGVLLFAFLLAPILVNANGVSTPITMQSTDTKYRNEVIGDARFGDADARKIIEQSFGFEKEVNQAIMGQEEPVAALHATLMQYLDGFQARKSSAGVPPLARHLIGFPGIGKSALIDYLRKILPVVQIDAQAYSTPEAIRDLSYSLESNQILKAKKPVILLIDEVDKLREIVPGQPEKTVPFIGALNQLLNEGRISGRSEIDLSHVLVVTTMNLPTEVIEEFSEQVLTTQKNFFDFTVEDFDKFSKWIDQDDSAIYKILARMYRTNTVTRLAANALIMNHLSNAIYHRIIEGTVRAAIKRQTEGSASARRISVEYSPRLVEFLYERTVFAPTGARDTVIKVNNIVEQLISYGMRGIGPNKSFASLKRPRKLFLDISPDGKGGLIQVTAQKRNGKILVDEPAFSIVTEYNKRMSAFLVPPDVLATRPIEAKDISHIVTQTMIRDVRYPKSEDKAKGLADQIGLRVYGQEETANKFEAEFSSYLSASSSLREPRSLVIAGVPGVGKSEIVLVTGEVLKLPVVRVNLQQFSSSGDDAPVKFLDTLEREIAKIKGKSPDGKYILLLEEMDKIDEIDPSGNPKDRPIITVVKDILDRGTSTLTVKGSYGGTQERNIDVREAFTIATMNFNGKIFDFKADPRLTTIEDVTRACKKINMSIGERKKVLEKMFRPDTINRMISRMIIMMPLQKEHYYKVIQAQFADVLEQRFRDKKGRNVGRVVLKPDQSFLDYLYNEAVIPSEGARFTKDVSKRLIQFSLDRPMKIVPNKFRAQPYEIGKIRR
jgi:ATP-dependent Clp protease ATP-binding subunit ClpA